MPLGKVNSGNFSHGTPLLLPHIFGNTVTRPEPFGNVIPQSNPTLDSNPVTWLPSPKHFGNGVGFSLQAVPPVILVPQSSSYATLIPITFLNGYFGAVIFTYSGAPVGVTVSFFPSPFPNAVYAIITVAPNVPLGKYTITITGTSGTEMEYTFAHTVIVTQGSTPSTDFLLQEDGSSLFELEDGSGFILLEV